MIVARRPVVLGHFDFKNHANGVYCVILTSMQPCFNASISNGFYKLDCQFGNRLPLQLDHNIQVTVSLI